MNVKKEAACLLLVISHKSAANLYLVLRVSNLQCFCLLCDTNTSESVKRWKDCDRVHSPAEQ